MKIQTRPLLRRILKIHNEINSGNYPNTEYLSRKLETGTATISRTIETMKVELDAPIKYDHKKRGYYYSKEYSIPFVTLTGDYANSLLCAKTLLMEHKDSPIYKGLEEALDDIISPNLKNSGSSLFNRIEVVAGAEYPIVPKSVWETVTKAVCENKVLTFKYKSRRQDAGEEELLRIVRPYEIILDKSNAYIFVFDENERRECKEKLFTISKIHEPVITDKTFDLPADHTFKEANGNGRFGAYKSPKGKMRFKVKFRGEALKEIESKTFFDDQIITKASEGESIMDFTSVQYERVLDWIIEFSSDAIPLEPEELVTEWKSKWTETINKMSHLLEGIARK